MAIICSYVLLADINTQWRRQEMLDNRARAGAPAKSMPEGGYGGMFPQNSEMVFGAF